MPIRSYKPLTPGRRGSTVDTFGDITKWEPEKSLIRFRKQQSGRDSSGRIAVRHRGGGARRYLRDVDFRQERHGIPAKVQAIEYDPGRGARLALVQYPDQERRYIVAPVGLTVGQEVVSYHDRGDIAIGNRLPLEFIPVGTFVYNVELVPNQGGKIARSAGTTIQVVAIEGAFAHLKMPSSEIRKVPVGARASIGQASNPDHRLIVLGKAGRMRHLGIRPRVRGKVMNPVDHPHGGGEGKQPIGMKAPKTLWGKLALGVKTRKPKRYSHSLILQRRKK